MAALRLHQAEAEAASPIGGAEFADLMSAVGPFEPSPKVAVGVSGGPDSLALALLIQDWARSRDGEAIAVTVDHGLRQESAREAAWVKAAVRPHGMRHHTLSWEGTKPVSALQAKARAARYGLLAAFCTEKRLLHLAVAHHREDQAETLLLRLSRGSGFAGLAGMAPVAERARYRLIRPLLPVSKGRLKATLQARGLTWLEDPSNADSGFTRVRMRQLLPDLAEEGVTADRLTESAGQMAEIRALLEDQAAEILARHVWLHPTGFLVLDWEAIRELPHHLTRSALAACLTTIGGLEFAPRSERLEGLHARLCAGLGGGATLGGCRVLPRRNGLLILREAKRIEEIQAIPGRTLRWDGRFRWILGAEPGPYRGGLKVTALRADGVPYLRERGLRAPLAVLPGPVRPTLPALRDASGLVAVPHLGFLRRGWTPKSVGNCEFRPQNPLTRAAFTVV